MRTAYFIEGNGFSIRVDIEDGSESVLGMLTQAVVAATVGAGDAITIRRNE